MRQRQTDRCTAADVGDGGPARRRELPVDVTNQLQQECRETDRQKQRKETERQIDPQLYIYRKGDKHGELPVDVVTIGGRLDFEKEEK